MRYRKLTDSGDTTFGRGPANFWVNVPDAPGQAVETRLDLEQGEWWLDNTEGTPYNASILGYGKANTYDPAIRQRISGTPGITGISGYGSSVDTATRALSVGASVSTVYGGPVTVAAVL